MLMLYSTWLNTIEKLQESHKNSIITKVLRFKEMNKTGIFIKDCAIEDSRWCDGIFEVM